MSKRIYKLKHNYIPSGAAAEIVNLEKRRRLAMEKNMGRILSDQEYNFIKTKIIQK